jgi:hypothetical protein
LRLSPLALFKISLPFEAQRDTCTDAFAAFLLRLFLARPAEISILSEENIFMKRFVEKSAFVSNLNFFVFHFEGIRNKWNRQCNAKNTAEDGYTSDKSADS